MAINKTKIALIKISVLLFLVSTLQILQATGTFDVTKYGAKANGEEDISKALLCAWEAACNSVGVSTVLIPKGKYALRQVDISGPCKGSMVLRVEGTVEAPVDPNELNGDFWIAFSHIDHFTVTGGGTFDGQGEMTWKKYNCMEKKGCKALPISLRFNFIDNAIVEDITSLDSKNFHVNVMGCKNITFQRFSVVAPGHSLNTDGIHIGRCNGVKILDSNIGTGDDCISIGDASQQITVKGVTCGPGHGISIGSLGKYPNEGPVSAVFISNCTLSNTDNGLRIKSWPALHNGLASNLRFEDIIMSNVSNPILIDQMYCPWNRCDKNGQSKVKISDVSFKNIRGTSTTPVAVQLICSKGIPCENVKLGNIDLQLLGGGTTKSQCSNVKPIITGAVPAGC
ncbi:polygalacturonase-like [Mercurialis annua]|uniref:polygalacturonase-like n=1 Tax=Mercurialis annua TaxID=3986 RepID=UPI00215E82CF|nr:polygalacturonase-like [Mercurialis annua]